MRRTLLFTVSLLAIIAATSAQCAPECSGSTPICEGSVCVPCTSNSQCWTASDNQLACDLNSGECRNCNSSLMCPEAAPICSEVTHTCATCNATAECALRLSGTICNTDLGTCGWCSDDANCTSYGSGSVCQNITTGVRKCSVAVVVPPPGATPPDPNNINGIITAYVIISIVLFMLFIMFIGCGTYSSSSIGFCCDLLIMSKPQYHLI